MAGLLPHSAATSRPMGQASLVGAGWSLGADSVVLAPIAVDLVVPKPDSSS
jgi:hypothetical protein